MNGQVLDLIAKGAVFGLKDLSAESLAVLGGEKRVHGWLVVRTASGPMQKSYQFGSRLATHMDPILVRFGSILLIWYTNGKPFTATNQMDFHNQSLDAYEAQLDQQIEENNGVTLCSHCI